MARVRITRAHLEEDVGKNFHFERNSGVDFNRAGVPLLEIVSEPEITGADMAYEYLNALKEILIYGGVSDADMEKGMVRCDVNVSVRPAGAKELGKKIEIKNMNSFSGARRALEYEIPRQIEVLQKGGQLTQETRRWDDAGGITETMREQGNGARLPLFPGTGPDALRADARLAGGSRAGAWSNCPWPKNSGSCANINCPPSDAQTFVWDRALGDYFEALARKAKNPKAAANWVINNLRAQLAATGGTLADLKFPPEYILDIMELVESRKISSSAAHSRLRGNVRRRRNPARHRREEGPGPSQRHRRD